MYRFCLRAVFFSSAVCLCLLATRPAAAQGLQPETPEKETIRGTVVNSVTHEAIGRALVFSPDNRFATMTDSEGHFEFTFSASSATEESTGTGPVVGRINPTPDRPDTLMARKPGFLDDRNTQVSTRGAAGRDLIISLTPEALIVGRVLLPSSDDSDRIQVELYRRQVREGRAHWEPAGIVISRSNGEFRFADLAAGSYKLLTRELLDRDPLTFNPRGQLYGYPPAYFPNAGSFASAETIQLSPGATFHANITVVRHAYYQVKVGVAGAEPGLGMNVTVYAEGRGPGYALGYDNQEHTITGMLPDGNYTVEAATYGPSPTTGLLNLSVKGAAVEGPGMILVHNGSVPVNVKEEFTSSEETGPAIVSMGSPRFGPRRYLNIFLQPADDFSIEQGASLRGPSGPEDESLVIDNVRPGRYWVRINSSRGFAASVSCGGVDLQHQPLVIGLGGSTSPIEVTMRDDGAEVEGTVEGVATSLAEASASQVQGWSGPVSFGSSAHVYLVPAPDSSGEFHEAWVSPDGRFTLRQVPPGVYHVLAFDRTHPELEYHNSEAMRAYESKGQVVSLVAGQKQQLQLQIISTSE